MKTSPFCQPEAPAWLAEDPLHQIPRLLEQLLQVAEYVPQVYEILPWLKGMDAWSLVQERMALAIFPDAPPSTQEAILTTFFAQVTQPMAERIERLYVSPLLRRVSTVEEIMRRMARRVGACALPFEVVMGVCCAFGRRRVCMLSSDPIQKQAAARARLPGSRRAPRRCIPVRSGQVGRVGHDQVKATAVHGLEQVPPQHPHLQAVQPGVQTDGQDRASGDIDRPHLRCPPAGGGEGDHAAPGA